MSDGEDLTQAKTLWLETLLEMLYVGLRKNKSDKDRLECLKDPSAKGYTDKYCIDKVDREVSHGASIRLQKVINSH